MRIMISSFPILLFSLLVSAKNIDFSTLDASDVRAMSDIDSSEEILSVTAETDNVVIKTKKPSTLTVPMINAQEAKGAAKEITENSGNVFCTYSQEVKSCEALWSRFKFHVERTKLFPSYYQAIESDCLANKDKDMPYGRLGNLGLEILQEGRLVKSFHIDEREISFLNNTNPLNSEAWLKIDQQRKKVVLLNVSSCKVMGEVPYR